MHSMSRPSIGESSRHTPCAVTLLLEAWILTLHRLAEGQVFLRITRNTIPFEISEPTGGKRRHTACACYFLGPSYDV
jgi:hypothetical protein